MRKKTPRGSRKVRFGSPQAKEKTAEELEVTGKLREQKIAQHTSLENSFGPQHCSIVRDKKGQWKAAEEHHLRLRFLNTPKGT